MQDIPRNELLDKLDAGWKVRRKHWHPDWVKGKDRDLSFLTTELLANDWEGEPPEPILSWKNTDIVIAFEQLRDGAAFIRRSAWTKASVNKNTVSLMCSIDDILANDWEVWE